MTLIVVANDASLLDVLAARHRAAWDRTQAGRQEWIEGTLELAAVLAEERKLLPADQDFSHWLERNGLAEINDHDRAALIGMAGDLVAARTMLEQTQRTSWQHIWANERPARVAHVSNPQQASQKRKSKTERQIIDRVLDLNNRGYTYDQTAAELGLTKGKVAGIVYRNDKAASKSAAPREPSHYTGYQGLDGKTLTREQVDPDFKGDSVQFAAKYGHVLLHTKAQIADNKQQEVLSAWLGAVSDCQKTARALAEAALPDRETLRQYLAKPGKAETLRPRLATIEAAYRNIAMGLELNGPQKKIG
jgi:hypothetical protein